MTDEAAGAGADGATDPPQEAKCSKCGAEGPFCDYYCPQGGRGATSTCADHRKTLVCGECIEDFLFKENGALRAEVVRLKAWDQRGAAQLRFIVCEEHAGLVPGIPRDEAEWLDAIRKMTLCALSSTDVALRTAGVSKAPEKSCGLLIMRPKEAAL